MNLFLWRQYIFSVSKVNSVCVALFKSWPFHDVLKTTKSHTFSEPLISDFCAMAIQAEWMHTHVEIERKSSKLIKQSAIASGCRKTIVENVIKIGHYEMDRTGPDYMIQLFAWATFNGHRTHTHTVFAHTKSSDVRTKNTQIDNRYHLKVAI